MNDPDILLSDDDVPHYTKRRHVLAGTFNMSRAAIPYFQGLMELGEVAAELRLVENLPSDLRSRWKLEELFQREIDWERVDHEIINGYLRRPEKLKFFNSLTVALLPLDDRRHLAREYGEPGNTPETPEKYVKAGWKTIEAGGVQLLRSGGSQPQGLLSWNPERVFAATIDGQHRLASLQRFFERGNLPGSVMKTTVSVLFLVLDDRFGFNLPELHTTDDDNPILTVVREIFIDLNKTAKTVNRTRQILLDDQNIESRCVRMLLAERIGERSDGRLPLGLVHWQGEVGAKFNAGEKTGPFITTVELLNSIVGGVLNLKRPKDPLSEDQVRQFVTSVEDAFGVSKHIRENPAKYPDLAPLMSYVENYYLKDGFEKPLANLPNQYLRVVSDVFDVKWRPLLVDVLLQFAPYKRFIKEVDKRGGIEGDLAFYLASPPKAQQQQAEEWGEERTARVDEPLQELAAMKKSDWPFYAVFQKALMRTTVDAWRHWDVTSPSGLDSDQATFMASWLQYLRHLEDAKLLAVRCTSEGISGCVWDGIALNPGSHSVKWSEAAVTRISSLLLLWWYVWLERRQKLNSFAKKLQDRASNEKFPGGKDALERLLKAVKRMVRGDDEDLSEKELQGRQFDRIVSVLAAAKVPGGQSE